MGIEKIKNHTTEEFVPDNYFLDWVLLPNQENYRFWSSFVLEYPGKKQQVKEAVFFIKALYVIKPSVSIYRLDNIYSSIKSSASRPLKTGQFLLGIAAVLLLLVSIGGMIYYNIYGTKNILKFEESVVSDQGKVKILLPDGKVSGFDTQHAEIHLIPTGELTVNGDTVTRAVDYAQAERSSLANILIPYGKQSQFIIACGSKIWLNSGSRFSYPLNFSGDIRQVYLSGEVFFDVQTDNSGLFQVITDDINIKVTGTSFNVNSYSEDPTTQAVVLFGKALAGRNRLFGGTFEITPGERLVYNKENDLIEKKNANVELFSSWING